MIVTKLFAAGATRLLAGASFVLLTTAAAFATPTLTLSAPDSSKLASTCTGGIIKTGVCTVIVTPGANGIVSFVGSVGNWSTVNVSGLTYPSIGTSWSPVMDLTGQESSKVKNPGNLTIDFTSTGFTIPTIGGGQVGLDASYGGTDMGTQSKFSVMSSPKTTLTGLSFTSKGSATKKALAFKDDTPLVDIFPGKTYSLTLVAVIVPEGTGSHISSFDMDLVGTPEPAFYSMTGIGLLGLLFVMKRRKMNQTEV